MGNIEENCDVVPFVVPYFGEHEDKLRDIARKLSAVNVETGIYHFNVNRNIFRANYRKCVPIPVHQRIPECTMNMICDTITKEEGWG